MSGSYSVVITEPAEADLQGIATYIAHDLLEPAAAKRIIARIAQAVLQPEQLPFRHSLVRDERLAERGLRAMNVESYIVFYTVSEQHEQVLIIRILFGKRNWNSLL